MVITINTSALLTVLLNEERKPVIIDLTKGHNLQSPLSLDAEIGNALSAVIKPVEEKKSPPDLAGISTDIKSDELNDAVLESREKTNSIN